MELVEPGVERYQDRSRTDIPCCSLIHDRCSGVDLDADTVALLREHKTRCEVVAVAGRVSVKSCPLFAQAKDCTRSWWPNWVTKRFAFALELAGVEQ